MIGGTHSGVGKTSIATGLMGAFARKGRRVQGFKIGPDFLDPSFHSAVTKRPSRNLDSWMIPRHKIPSIFGEGCQGADIAIIEGVMGVFDGIDGKSDLASTSEVAKMLKAPLILVLDAHGLAGSAAAIVLGYKNLDPQLRMDGVILNRVAGDAHAQMCRDAISRHASVPVIGAIPEDPKVHLPERHLGLVPAFDMKDQTVLNKIVDLVESSVELSQIETLANKADDLSLREEGTGREKEPVSATTIAVARDQVFNFYYEENLEKLVRSGAQLKFFSPLVEERIPEDVHGIYIGGGYPEVYASALSKNNPMLKSILNRALDESPVLAECGGLMYLTRSIQDPEGKDYGSVGLLDARTRMVNRLTLSYTLAKTRASNVLTRSGETLRGHEFHYSVLSDVPEDADFAYEMQRGVGITDRKDGWMSHQTLASYMHTSFAADDRLAKRFVAACIKYSRM